MVLLDRLKDGPSREWYLRASIEYGWSRNVLTHHISTQLREREGKALHQFFPNAAGRGVRPYPTDSQKSIFV
jgi:predicted nuclease of restriction endonuclease-like (RecB) superfamily